MATYRAQHRSEAAAAVSPKPSMLLHSRCHHHTPRPVTSTHTVPCSKGTPAPKLGNTTSCQQKIMPPPLHAAG